MNTHWKYTLEKNKEKIISGVVLVLISGGIWGLYGLLTTDSEAPDDETAQVDFRNVLAEHMMTLKDQTLSIVGTQTGEAVATYEFERPILYVERSADLESAYFFDGEAIYEASFDLKESENTIDVQKLATFKLGEKPYETQATEESESVLGIQVNEHWIAVATTHGLHTMAKSGETHQYTSVALADSQSVVLSDDEVLYASGETLYRQSLVPETGVITDFEYETFRIAGESEIQTPEQIEQLKEKHATTELSIYPIIAVSFGANHQSITTHGESVLIMNEFGEGKGTTSFFKIDPETMLIDEVVRHEHARAFPVDTDSDDEVYAFVDEGAAKRGAHHTFEFKDIGVSRSRSVLSFLVETDTSFNSENTVSTKGYLYTTKSGKLEIVRLSGEVIEVERSADYSFFMPISTEELTS